MKQEVFQERIHRFKKVADRNQVRVRQLSWVRVLWFILMIVSIIYFANAKSGETVFAAIALFALTFPALVNLHNGKKKKADHAQTLVNINQE